jgi:transposase InsO family protein
VTRQQGWQGAFRRRGGDAILPCRTRGRRPAPDRVNRYFTAIASNRLWVADATRIPCGEGTFWLAAVRDAFSNPVVGWRCSSPAVRSAELLTPPPILLLGTRFRARAR